MHAISQIMHIMYAVGVLTVQRRVLSPLVFSMRSMRSRLIICKTKPTCHGDSFKVCPDWHKHEGMAPVIVVYKSYQRVRRVPRNARRGQFHLFSCDLSAQPQRVACETSAV